MKKNKGITLVSLVVTIIVLLVLAAITLNLVIGENGVISKAQDANYYQRINTKDEELFLETEYVTMGEQISNTNNYMKKNISADYIQPWLASEWQVKDFELYFDKLLENNIDTCILQYSSKIEVKNGKPYFSEFYFWVSESNPYADTINNAITADTSRSSYDIVDSMLKAAQNKNINVYLGIGNSDGWFREEFQEETWRNEVVNLNNTVSAYLIKEYKENYPNIFEGIYIPLEFYTNSKNYEELYWRDMLSEMRKGIKENEIAYLQDMPIMISTYCSELKEYLITEEEMKKGIKALVSVLKEDDIVCTQDKIATNYATSVKYNLKYLELVGKVVKEELYPLQYWVNVETFYPIVRPSTKKVEAASLARIEAQLQIAYIYSDKIAMFSFAHYYMSQENGHPILASQEIERNFYKKIDSLEESKIKEQYRNMHVHYFDNGTAVPIPDGFYYITGDLETGVVISDKESDIGKKQYWELTGNQFVWIPVDIVKFKRDIFKFNDITLSELKESNNYWEEKDEEYLEMYKSILKNEGFYVARYETSLVDNQIKSIAGQYIYNNAKLLDAEQRCNELYKNNSSVKSHVMYGIEWDTMLKSFIGKTNSYDNKKINYTMLRESQDWGNYGTITEHGSQKISGDTAMQNTQIYNIFDLAGNFWELTQEYYGDNKKEVLRGGSFWEYGNHNPVSYRFSPITYNDYAFLCTFRIAMYLK